MISVTRSQREILRFIVGYQAAHGGVSPSHGDICAGLGYASKSTVNRLLQGIEARGMMRRLRHRERAIEVLEPITIPRATDGAPLYFIPIDRAQRIAALAIETRRGQAA